MTEVGKDEIESLFSEFGKVLDVVVKSKSDTYAFVEFEDAEGAQKAVEK